MIVTLEIGRETYNVLHCRYKFHRSVDSKGLPRGGMKGGDIIATLETTKSDQLFEVMTRKGNATRPYP